jgi:hypothetical protein
MTNKRKITHFYAIPPQEGLWVPIGFLTQDTKGVYYPGFDKRPYLDDSRKPCTNYELLPEGEKLKDPLGININTEIRSLWISPEGEIYFTLQENPIEDPNKIFVAKPNLEGLTHPADDFLGWVKGLSENQ